MDLEVGLEQAQQQRFSERSILSVSDLVWQIREALESNFRDIWVRGEISNFHRAPSQHCYLTLKDRESQIRAVCFKLASQHLRFEPEDGMDVVARGTVSVYTRRGDFQLIIDFMEPVGPGALQVAFEQLKEKLKRHGLFDPARKRPLPKHPSKIGVLTSPSGAAIKDILKVLQHRNDRVDILIYPTRVQGTGAAVELTRGIRHLGRRSDLDVIIMARGGGSLEDLWAFNDEGLARAIASCPKPVISAVGHETDFTIADFVADVRAPTPSAAAEMVSGARAELADRLAQLSQRLAQAVHLTIQRKKTLLQQLSGSRAFVDAETRLRYFLQRLDELQLRLSQSTSVRLAERREALNRAGQQLQERWSSYLERTSQHSYLLEQRLLAYSPLAVLERGYAIVTQDGRRVVRDPQQVAPGEKLGVQVAKGRFSVTKDAG